MSVETNKRSTPVSIIIPVYNRLDFTRQCLTALRSHTTDFDHEIIVVDNGSTDGTTEELRELHDEGRLHAILNEENLGFATACNQGAAAARHPYVLFLNNDTEVTDGWLGPLVSTLDLDQSVAAAGSKLLFPDGTIQHAGICLTLEELPAGRNLATQHLCYGKSADFPSANRPQMMRCLTAACLLVRTEAFHQVQGFDTGYWNGYEDVDLCLKMVEQGWSLVFRPESVAVHYECQSGDERFSRLKENSALLNERWLDRVEPDYYLGLDKTFTPAPSFSIRTYADLRLRFPKVSKSGNGAPTASVIILTHNALDSTRKCVDSLLKHTDERHELIFVDNASSDGTPEYLSELSQQHEQCHVLFNQENLGYAAGNNIGMAFSNGEFIVLLNSDVVVTEGWLETLIQAAVEHPQAGLIGPVTNSIAGPQKLPKVNYDQETLEGLDKFSRGISKASHGNDELVLWLVGFCLLIRRDLVARIGGLDERFGRGNFEDNDFCLRNFLAGHQALIATDCFVHHFGSRSFEAAGVNYGAELENKWEIFKDKWNIPMETPYGGDIGLTEILLKGYNPVLHHENLPHSPNIVSIIPQPEEIATVMAQGEDAFTRGLYGDAETFFQWLMRWDPENSKAANNLAVTLWTKGKPDQGLEILEGVLKRDPDDADAAWNLREIRKAMTETTSAEAQPTEVAEPTPTA